MLSVAACGLADLVETSVDELLVAVLFEGLQARDLFAFGGGVDAHDVGHLDVIFDEAVDADDDVLPGAVALVISERGLLDLRLDEIDRLRQRRRARRPCAISSVARDSISSVNDSTK